MFGQKRIPSREGGVEIVVEELCTRMVAQGHNVTCYNRGGHAVVGFDANGKRVFDSGWQTGATYTLGKDVVSYRLLFSYTDNRTMTSADTLKIESSITFSAVETKSSVIEVGSFGTDGKNTVSSNRARTVYSYKVSEKTFKFESSKAAGMRYQEVVKIEMNSISVLTDMNKNTDTAAMELMIGNVNLRISNETDPLLLAKTIQILAELSC